MAALFSLRRLLFVLLAALLIASCFQVPGVRAQDQVDDLDEETEASADAAAEFDATDGTEVVATGEDVEEVEEELLLTPGPGVETSYIFPASSAKTPPFRAGKQAELLIAVNNTASAPLKLTAIVGRLFIPYDYRIVGQNFTGELPSNVTFINATVPTGATSSFLFLFTPFKMLQPMEFGLSVSLRYQLEGISHASTVFNSTIEVTEPAGFISGETVFLLLLSAGLLSLAGMWVSSQLDAISKRAKRAKKVETGTGSEPDAAQNEWLQGTFFVTNKGKPATKAKKRR